MVVADACRTPRTDASSKPFCGRHILPIPPKHRSLRRVNHREQNDEDRFGCTPKNPDTKRRPARSQPSVTPSCE